MLSIANLICGSLSICSMLTSHRYDYAFMLMILAGVFDFFDGFAARLLNQTSPLGVELDSLADIVSFGFAPSVIMMSLFEDGVKLIDNPTWISMGYFIPLIIVAFSALRLAKFNIDENQSVDFIGLPTPACALFCASIGLLHQDGYSIAAEYIIAISVMMAILLLLPIKMFSLKFKGYGWSGNGVRYSFLIASLVLLVALRLNAITLIIPLYIAVSATKHTIEVCRGERPSAK